MKYQYYFVGIIWATLGVYTQLEPLITAGLVALLFAFGEGGK